MIRQPQLRIGQGSDLHRLQKGDGLWLGGVRIPCALASVAHSDGDALLHAVTDALLGALGEGDIGEWFPDSAPENRKRASAEFLQSVLRGMQERGYALQNLDTTIHLQLPKLSPHKAAIRESLARLCGVQSACVNVKAKTGEGLGAVGKGQAVAADAVVLLLRGEPE